jgi:hypothetical protein
LVAAMQQISGWLKKLGMSEYTDRFVENRIDISVLPDLTEQHLKDLGIALGDRLKMLRGIRWPISVTPKRMNMMLSARFAPVSVLSKRFRSSPRTPVRPCRFVSASPPAL